jgi:hypothetical protein
MTYSQNTCASQYTCIYHTVDVTNSENSIIWIPNEQIICAFLGEELHITYFLNIAQNEIFA